MTAKYRPAELPSLTERPRGRQTFALVDSGALRHNVRQMRDVLPPAVQLAAIVKADAYGHGALQTARAALDGGASMLGVAMAEEALPLRGGGIQAPILVIGPSNPQQMALGAELGLDLCVFTPQHLRQAEREAAARGCTLRVHLKADTGMRRIGFQSTAELRELLTVFADCPHLALTGCFSHFATADSYADQSAAAAQHALFAEWLQQIRTAGYRPLVHISNSAAAQDLPAFDHDMVRLGISMYGYPPSGLVPQRVLSLRPAMQVWAEVSHVKTIAAGDAVGYGAAFRADRPMRVATVQIGYGDGYNRLLSGRGRMIVPTSAGGCYAPVLGRVCMDMTMIDVTGIEDLGPGDLVLAMGRLGSLHADADDIAGLCGTISYEVLLDYTKRLPRLSVDSGAQLPAAEDPGVRKETGRPCGPERTRG